MWGKVILGRESNLNMGLHLNRGQSLCSCNFQLLV